MVMSLTIRTVRETHAWPFWITWRQVLSSEPLPPHLCYNWHAVGSGLDPCTNVAGNKPFYSFFNIASMGGEEHDLTYSLVASLNKCYI